MRDPLKHIKPEVRELRAYTLAARPAPIKINQNENPFELPEAFKRRVLDRALARPWGRYPGFVARDLAEALAAFTGWRSDGILAGNGSNELILALLLVSVGPGTAVVIPEPSFALYGLLTGILGGRVVGVAVTPDLQYDAEALLAARRACRAPLTVICSPNNPTGSVLQARDVSRLCTDDDGLVVIDEAYHEFAGETVVPLLARHENLIVLRTFSKALALAGLRIGYLLAHPALVREVNKARLPYNLNFFSELVALAALQERAALGAAVARLVRLRDALSEALSALPGVRVHPSRANFFLLEIERGEPKLVFEALYRQGILVRDVTSYPGLSRCLRVSVGTEEENAALVRAMPSALAEAAQGGRVT